MLELRCGLADCFRRAGHNTGTARAAAVLERVVGFDYDANSVQASLALRERSGLPAERWDGNVETRIAETVSDLMARTR